MDKKKIIISIAAVMTAIAGLHAQVRYSYEPLSSRQQTDIQNDMFINNVQSFLMNDRIVLGPVNLTNIVNMVSYNPVEGTRIRLSAETNNSLFAKNKLLRNRLLFSGKIAYGTRDNKIKYGASAAYNFAKKPQGVYSFPCSTLSVNWEDDTYMPSYPDYDVAYFSFGEWDRFYFARKRQFTIQFLKEFQSAFAICPYFYWQKTVSYMLYDSAVEKELLDNNYDFINKAAGAEISYTPGRKSSSLFDIFNSRFYTFNTQIKVNISYNVQSYINYYEYSKAELTAQKRFLFLPLALDIRVVCGKIFGNSDPYMYFTPNYALAVVSNMYGFNLYLPADNMYKEYMQTFTQLNFGGVLLDNIKALKKNRPNGFVNFKSLIMDSEDFYAETGAGIDHIFGFLGFEIVKKLSGKDVYGSAEWGFKIRCSL